MGLKSNEVSVTFDSSSVSEIRGIAHVYSKNGHIIIEDCPGKRYMVSAADAKVVAEGVSADIERIPVSEGVYIVNIDKTAKKIIVK